MFYNFIKFYKQALTGEEKLVYEQLEQAFYNRCKEISIAKSIFSGDIEKIIEIMSLVYNDNPELFYVEAGKLTYANTKDSFELLISYLYSEEQIIHIGKEIGTTVKSFLSKYIDSNMGEYEKELLIHDYLATTIIYDEEAKATKGHNCLDAYNVFGAVIKKKAVCWGIACAFKLFCDYAKIKCLVVIGSSKSEDEYSENHAWNIVKINGKNYHVDLTWDIKSIDRKEQMHDYFNICDEEIKHNHDWQFAKYPRCIWHDDSYYFRNNLFINRIEQLKPYILRHLRKGRKTVIVKIRGIMPSQQNIQTAVSEALKEYMDFAKLSGSVKYSIDTNEKIKNIYIKIFNA